MLFLAYTGVRFGEMAALRVGRIDLSSAAPSSPSRSRQCRVWGWSGAPPRPTSDARSRSRGSSPTTSPTTSRGKQPDDLVFAGIRSGQPLRVGTFRAAFDAAAEAIGVPDLHPHELRHTAASLAIASGADVKVVQQMLGHGSATMTLDTYGHLFDDRLDEVGDAMDRARAQRRERRARRPRWARPNLLLPQCCPSGIRADDCRRGPGRHFRWSGPISRCTPNGIRTRATAVKGRRPRPLDDGGLPTDERTRGGVVQHRATLSRAPKPEPHRRAAGLAATDHLSRFRGHSRPVVFFEALGQVAQLVRAIA